MPTGSTAPVKGLSLNASTFQPFIPGQQTDHTTKTLKEHGVEDKDEVKKYKDYITELKKCLDSANGVISLDLFKKIGELGLCKGESKCINKVYVERNGEDLEPAAKNFKGRPKGNNPRGGQGGNDFAMGT